MAFFYKFVTLSTRLPPVEVERRLLRIIRKPRTLREVLHQNPLNPPEHPDFVGWLHEGRFKLTRLALAPDDLAHSYIRRPPARGWITPAEKGSHIKILFCDPALSLMAAAMILISSFVVLLNTRGWPLFRLEHGMLALTVGLVLWFCRYSLHDDIAKSVKAITKCLN